MAERSSTEQTSGRIRRADDAVADLLARLAPEHDGDGDPSSPMRHALQRLSMLFELQTAIVLRLRGAAIEAAMEGANYAQLGAACGITRQGARQRWPGLVFTRPAATDDHEGLVMQSTDTPRTYTVLLVEDDDADAMLIEESLIERGMARTVHRAEDGVAALAFLRAPGTPRPDLIVLDLNMPRMNGRELLAVLKNEPPLSSIPIVVLTTSAAPDDISGAYREHANAYVTKPVNLDDFINSVQSIDAFFLDTATIPTPQTS